MSAKISKNASMLLWSIDDGIRKEAKLIPVKNHKIDINFDFDEKGELHIHGTDWIAPSSTHTLISYRATLKHDSVHTTKSQTYLAAVRRRNCKTIKDRIMALQQHSTEEHFATYTFPVLKLIQDTIQEIESATTEGNSCEILRLIRDSFLGKGYQSYRSADIRNKSIKLLSTLIENELVDSSQAADAVDVMLDHLDIPSFLSVDDDAVSELRSSTNYYAN